MRKPIFVDRSKLRTGDVVSTTANDLPGFLIRFWTSGIFSAFDLSKATHTGIISVEDGVPWIYEMGPTDPVLRYVSSNAILDYESYRNLPQITQDQFRVVTVKSGVKKTPIDQYEHNINGRHIVSVGRHRAFDKEEIRQKCTEKLQHAKNVGVSYDWTEIFNRVIGKKDADTSKDICSRLVWRMFLDLGIDMPNRWAKYIDPIDWQLWTNMSSVDFKAKV